ncbi:unnamed protein product [Pieris macdunnoughi]|uniref:Uncharacterized protein n=1 Tax=Pieris macdunnoughi TaxID=345717 RepID=A0A821PAU4_9NEOP|nr:unnamed protein product [Pieris macdunnoughi]
MPGGGGAGQHAPLQTQPRGNFRKGMPVATATGQPLLTGAPMQPFVSYPHPHPHPAPPQPTLQYPHMVRIHINKCACTTQVGQWVWGGAVGVGGGAVGVGGGVAEYAPPLRFTRRGLSRPLSTAIARAHAAPASASTPAPTASPLPAAALPGRLRKVKVKAIDIEKYMPQVLCPLMGGGAGAHHHHHHHVAYLNHAPPTASPPHHPHHPHHHPVQQVLLPPQQPSGGSSTPGIHSSHP